MTTLASVQPTQQHLTAAGTSLKGLISMKRRQPLQSTQRSQQEQEQPSMIGTPSTDSSNSVLAGLALLPGIDEHSATELASSSSTARATFSLTIGDEQESRCDISGVTTVSPNARALSECSSHESVPSTSEDPAAQASAGETVDTGEHTHNSSFVHTNSKLPPK
jgi:hypothetical protein